MVELHKALFLRPELSVVTNLGAGGAVRCAESLAEFLVGHGSPNLLVTAIRGDNLLPDLESLVSTDSLPRGRKILSAHVEIGGGPIATAFADGAQFIVTGAHDISAPLLAAAVSRGFASWQDHHQLALLAAASQFESVIVEVDADGSIEVERGAGRTTRRPSRAWQRIPC